MTICEGDMTICSPSTGYIARGRIVTLTQGQQLFYYTKPLLKQISDKPQDKNMTTNATAHLGEYDVKGLYDQLT